MGKNLDYSTKKKIVFGALIFLGITLLCLVTNLFSFYKSFLIGTFGLITYPAIIIAMIFCGLYIANKVVSFDKKVLGLSIATLCLFLCILQMALTANLDFSSFASFVGASYESKATPAGSLFSILIYPFKYLLFDIGAYIVFSIAIIALVAYMIDMYYDRSRSKERTVGAKVEHFDRTDRTDRSERVEKFDKVAGQGQGASDGVSSMELRASADRLSSNNADMYEDFGGCLGNGGNAVNNNGQYNQNYSSTSNESIINGSFDKNGNNLMEGYHLNAEGEINRNANMMQNGLNSNSIHNGNNNGAYVGGGLSGNESGESQKDREKLLTDRVKAKLGLIDSADDYEDEEDAEDYGAGKSDAFKLLYPQKCKGKNDSNYKGKSSSLNSINRYFDNSSSRGKKVDDEEYKAKYREYTTQKYNIGYSNLNNAVSAGGSPMDGIISGDDYRSKSKASSSKYANGNNSSSSSIFSDKDKQKTDEVFGGMKADLNLHKKVVSKRMGDGLIMTDVVEEYNDVDANPSTFTGEDVSQIDRFDVGNNGGILSENANGYGGGFNYGASQNAFMQNNYAETKANYRENYNDNQNQFNSNLNLNSSASNGESIYGGNGQSRFNSDIIAGNSENCIKSNVQNSSFGAVENAGNISESKSGSKENEINQIKPILKVEGKEVEIDDNDLTPFDSSNFENEKLGVDSRSGDNFESQSNLINENQSDLENVEDEDKEVGRNSFGATILPKSDNLAINVKCESENEIDDEKLIDTFDEISLTPLNSNHFDNASAYEDDGVQNQISGGSNDFENESESESESFGESVVADNLDDFEDEKDVENENVSNSNLNNLNNQNLKANENKVESVSRVANENKPLKSIFEKENERKAELEKANVPYVPPKPYNHPPVEFLTVESTDMSELVDDTEHKSQVLESSLESFKVPAKVSNVVIGPTVTRYEMTMPAGISVKKIVNYADDIAMALAAKGGIRIEAPIPGKNAVGIEVPNDKRASIGFKEVFESGEFYKDSNPLNFVLGKDINGKFIFCNLAKAPHLLVAGSTGSGKSVCLNILILSIIYKSSPEDVRLVLVDPKRVEFAIYEGLPHLMLPNIITEPEKAVNTFTWAINEMEKRYTLFQSYKVRDIGEYNKLPDIVAKKKPKMPYVVIIVDELADLMTVCKKEIEDKIARIAAKARSAGIHLVLATQRPSIDVITGTIKNNFPTRIAFSLTAYADSKTILDQGGAEKLLGKGDMLYAPQDQNEPTRIQAPFVTGGEINDIVDYVKSHNEACYEDNIVNKMLNKGGGEHKGVGVKDPTEDEMFVPALKVVIETNQASSSLLQRKLSLGWNRASKLTDAMEDMGYISRPDGNNKRQILITKEQFRELYGDID